MSGAASATRETVYVGSTRGLSGRTHVLTDGPRTLCGIHRAQIRQRHDMRLDVFESDGYSCRTCKRQLVLSRRSSSSTP